jgi:triphosphatase
MGGPSGTPIGDGVEVEWQFDAIDLRPVERWLADPGRWGEGVGGFEVAPGEARRQVDQYLDTDDWRLGRAGLTLRIRQTGHGEEITLKDRGSRSASGLRRRLEVTETLPTDGSAGMGTGMGTTGPVGRRIAAVAAQRPLRQILEVRTRRLPFALSLDGTPVAEVALDDTVIGAEGGELPVRLRRVEIEARPDLVAQVEPLVTALQHACGLQPALLSKFEAGLLALGLEVPGPPDLGPTEVTPNASIGELARAVVRQHLGAMLAHEAGTRLGVDIVELHDLGVATRRLRAALALFGEVLPIGSSAVRHELKWLAQQLGSVRDLDVQLERFTAMAQPPDGGRSPGEDSLAELRALLEEERASAREQLLEALESPRLAQLVERLRAIASDDGGQDGPGAVPAAVAVPPLVLSRHHAAVRAANRARRTGKASDFHRLRIRCKWLRYCLEFTTDLYRGHTQKFIRRLARLQDELGHLQDVEVAIERLTSLAEREGVRLPPRTIFAMGEMAERYRAEGGRLLAQLPDRARVLEHKDWLDVAKLMERRRAQLMAATPLDQPPGTPRVPGPEDAEAATHTAAEAATHTAAEAATHTAAEAAMPATGRNGHPHPVDTNGTGDTPVTGWPEVSWGIPASG